MSGWNPFATGLSLHLVKLVSQFLVRTDHQGEALDDARTFKHPQMLGIGFGEDGKAEVFKDNHLSLLPCSWVTLGLMTAILLESSIDPAIGKPNLTPRQVSLGHCLWRAWLLMSCQLIA